MKAEHLDEPELEFGGGGRHVDIRFGLLEHGPLDKGTARDIRVGLVGTQESIEGVTSWLKKCRDGVPAKPSRQPTLFPGFPGFSHASIFGVDLVLDPALCADVPTREIDRLVSRAKESATLDEAVHLFLERGAYLVEKVKPDVLVCAPPTNLLAALEGEELSGEGGEGPADDEDEDAPHENMTRAFHDVLKARGMSLVTPTPIQMVRPETYGAVHRRQRRRPERDRRLQDPATRAWNFHTALYYKAGGTPWRIARSDEYTTCYIGVGFYKSLDHARMMTSMAQVFNTRGDGVVVRGGPARLDKNDPHPHLEETDAAALLTAALRAYRLEHRTQPARVVIHKSSAFDAGELAGFRAAAQSERVDSIDLLSLYRSFTRLFRRAYHPPLRGTLLALDDVSHVLYLKGSVEFFRTWPGLYVPRPLGFRVEEAAQSSRFLAQEMLALSKQNWNNTQFDGGWPITLRAAQRVGSILKHCGERDILQARYSYYM